MKKGSPIMLLTVVVSLLLLGAGLLFFFGQRKGYRNGYADCKAEIEARSDTVYVHDTLTFTKDSIIYRERTVKEDVVAQLPMVDSTGSATDSTVDVVIPIEYLHEHYAKADVWYHGYNAGIDSLQVRQEYMFVTIGPEPIKEKHWEIYAAGGLDGWKEATIPYVKGGLMYHKGMFGFGAAGGYNGQPFVSLEMRLSLLKF